MTDLSKDELSKWVERYRCMPDYYHDGQEGHGPHTLVDNDAMKTLGYKKGRVSAIWEMCAGSGKLSAWARQESISHLLPTDFRWGFDKRLLHHQMPVLYTLLVYGCSFLFVSPNCTPWGNNQGNCLPQSAKRKGRQSRSGFNFFAYFVICKFSWDAHMLLRSRLAVKSFRMRTIPVYTSLESMGWRQWLTSWTSACMAPK